MRSDKVRTEDLSRLREEILNEISAQFNDTLGEKVVHKVLERASERAANIQRAQQEAESARDEAYKLTKSYQERLVAAEAELKNLKADIAGEKQSLDDLRINTAVLAQRRDELLKEVDALKDELKNLSAEIADRKIERVG